jgi:uncharacterized membrane protein
MNPKQPFAFWAALLMTFTMIMFEFVIYQAHTEVRYAIPPMGALAALFFYLTYIRKQ